MYTLTRIRLLPAAVRAREGGAHRRGRGGHRGRDARVDGERRPAPDLPYTLFTP